MVRRRADSPMPYRRPLCLTRLEDRTAPAVATWDGGGADDRWTTPGNWAGDTAPAPGDDLSARITLRLPETLKAGVEAAAAREGVSANAWIVRALARALEPRAARRSSNRLQGFARS